MKMTAEDYYRSICQRLHLKRFNSATEGANLVSFLLSDKTSGITDWDWLMQTIRNQS